MYVISRKKVIQRRYTLSGLSFPMIKSILPWNGTQPKSAALYLSTYEPLLIG